jgi:hypothetical protein
MADLARTAFVPLAEYVAARFSAADSYEAFTGDPGDRIYHFLGDDIVADYSMHEIKAALAILTAREGGWEFGLSRDPGGRYHFVQGLADRVELDGEITGTDLIFHTHPQGGAASAHASQGDLYAARAFDPDRRAAAVSQDGWSTEYSINEVGGVESSAAARLWRATR